MKMTRRAVVLAALCAGLLAALLAYVFLQRQSVRAAEMSQPVTVVVAAQDIPARTMIEPGMVYETQKPVGALPANCAVSVREVMGRVTTAALATDEPVRRSVVSPLTASLGLAYVVPEGMRAVAVALDPIIGVAGFLKAGDRVDVLATFAVDKLSVTKTVLQNVELLAIGPEVVPEETKGSASEKAGRPKEQPNATLAVTPQQAEKLILAEAEGKLRLVLRRAGDESWVSLQGVRIDALTGIRPGSTTKAAAAPAPAPRASAAPPPAWSVPRPFVSSSKVEPLSGVDESGVVVETIRGTKKTTVDVSPE
jgi:pilus assembly protein CpaB